MSQNAESRQLTPEDPVDAETLEQFKQLAEARHRFADQLLTLELEKVKILRASQKIDEQRTRLFEGTLVDRGLPPDAPVEIDSATGEIRLLKKPTPVVPET